MTLEDMFPTAELAAGAIDAPTANELRTSITGYTRYALLDRGSYEIATPDPCPVLDRAVNRICSLAGEMLGGRTLAPYEIRALRLTAGDYLLARHDRVHEGRPIELVLDISPFPVQAEIQYRRLGQVFFRMPGSPRSLAIVERTPAITCNHSYVSKLRLGVELVRLVVMAR
jgi:hypothetical protein